MFCSYSDYMKVKQQMWLPCVVVSVNKNKQGRKVSQLMPL